MRLLALILIAWLWAVISVQAHQFDAKHCDDAIDTDQLRECLAENLTKSDSWDINKSTNAEGADFLEARLESHDHIACGEKSGHLELVFICSERVPIVFVTGTCRFADHARFGRFNLTIGEKRRQKFVATPLDGGNALGPQIPRMSFVLSTRSPMLKKLQFKSNHSHGCPRTRHSIQLRMVHRLMKYGQRVWSKSFKRNSC